MHAAVAISTLAAAVLATSPPPDPQLDCALRNLALNVSIVRVGSFADMGRVYDALQLSSCNGTRPVASPGSLDREPGPTELSVWVSALRGDDSATGTAKEAPVATLHAAQRVARSLIASRGGSAQRVTVYCEGAFYLPKTLALDAATDAHTTWRSWPGSADRAVLSGGVPLRGLSWTPSSRYPPPVLEAALPAGVLPDAFESLFDGDAGTRLPLAREPNGNAETDLQPTGYALVDGNPNGSLPFPVPGPGTHVEVDEPQRNSSVFPVFGRDYDPRNPPIGYVWYTEAGGPASLFAGNVSFWNKTLDGGFRWNATGGIDPHSGLPASPFNASGWPRTQREPRRAHIFHNALWGNWVYAIDAVDEGSRTFTFSEGGWQEARGGGMGTQPFFVEGAAQSLDAPGEWWVDAGAGLLHLWPNATAADNRAAAAPSLPPSTLVVPVLETLVVVGPAAPGVVFEGVTFTQTIDGLLLPYSVPTAGDWSLRAAAAVAVDGGADVALLGCSWLRVGGNGLIVTGNASNVTVDEAVFLFPGSSGVVVLGRVPRANGTAATAGVPTGVTISRSVFEGIGVLGKQSSALFVSLSCNVTLASSVLYSGPRAGINIDDGFCGGHSIQDNVIFDWVRETQDHGPINTWDRQRYTMPPMGRDVPEWQRVVRNFILNGPSGNRDLGNLFPAVDNDDGSAYYWIAGNVVAYGGFKNYLGHDKVWDSNLIIFPDRWSGDPCLCAWGGEGHVYSNNTCITTSDSPQAFDSSVSGNTCEVNYTDPNAALLLPTARLNTYHTPDGTFFEGCAAPYYTLATLQAVGQELGSASVRGYDAGEVISQAQHMLLGA